MQDTSFTLAPHKQTDNTTTTWPIPHDAGCRSYFFGVSALNIVGTGEPATINYSSIVGNVLVIMQIFN